jgi:hypothetical protein
MACVDRKPCFWWRQRCSEHPNPQFGVDSHTPTTDPPSPTHAKNSSDQTNCASFPAPTQFRPYLRSAHPRAPTATRRPPPPPRLGPGPLPRPAPPPAPAGPCCPPGSRPRCQTRQRHGAPPAAGWGGGGGVGGGGGYVRARGSGWAGGLGPGGMECPGN